MPNFAQKIILGILCLTLAVSNTTLALSPSSPLKQPVIFKGKELVQTIDDILDSPIENKNLCLNVLQSGIAILSHPQYVPYLKEEGFELKKSLQRCLDEINSNIPWNKSQFNDFKDLIRRIPTIKNSNDDLFIDVFDGFSDEELRILANAGYAGDLSVNLVRGCSNRCLMCAESAEQLGKRMIYPIAVKIFKKLEGKNNRVKLYGAGEPLDTKDSVIGAELNDYVDQAIKYGFSDVSLVIHGLGGKQAAKSEQVIKKLNTSFDISFHLFHRDVIRHIKKSLAEGYASAKEQQEEEQKIIDRYVKRYVPLIEGALDGKKNFGIRRFIPTYENPNHTLAFDTFYELKKLSDTVWAKVKQEIGQDRFQREIEATKSVREVNFLFWVSQAALLLKELGVPEDEINSSGSIVQNHQLLFVEGDGSIQLATRETQTMCYRNVEQMFDSYQSETFKQFTTFLNFMLSAPLQETLPFFDPDYPTRGNTTRYDRCMPVGKLDKELKDLLKRIYGETIPDNLFFGISLSGVLKNVDYAQLLAYFLMTPEKLGTVLDLLEQPKTDATLKELFTLLKDIPFPSEIEIYLHTKLEGQAIKGRTKYIKFATPKMNIFNILPIHKTERRAYSPNHNRLTVYQDQMNGTRQLLKAA